MWNRGWLKTQRKGCIMTLSLRGRRSRRSDGLVIVVLFGSMLSYCLASGQESRTVGRPVLSSASGSFPRHLASSPGGLSCGASKRWSRSRRKAAGASHVVHRHFAEIEVTLSGLLTLRHLEMVPRAPGSFVELLDDNKRVRAQLAASVVGDLIEQGADVTVLRDFMLSERASAPTGSTPSGLAVAAAECAGDFAEGENALDYPIPESDWVRSDILIDGAVSNAVVTCVDVHFEVVHSLAGDLWIDLSDEDLTHEYTLRFMVESVDGNVSETVTGITDFAGEGVNQAWSLWATDVMPGQEGYIDYWWIKVYYEVPTETCAHDAWDHPVVLADGVAHWGTTVGATGQYETQCGFHDSLDVWHVYTPLQSGLVTIRAESDDFDTTLAVFDPCGVERGCSDDGCEGSNSIIAMPVVAGAEYFIRVAGYDYGTGTYALIVSSYAPELPDAPSRPRPVDGAPVSGLPIVLLWNGAAQETNVVDVESLASKPEAAGLLLPRTIYGRDDRAEEYEVTDPRFLAVGEATAMLAYRRDLQDNGDGTYQLQTESFAYWYEWLDPIGTGNALCNDEPFRDQPSVGVCTGVLVAPDVIATAGHCVACSPSAEIVAVFGFVMQDANTATLTVNAADVYGTAGIVSYQADYPDWGLIRLDREVQGRTPLPVRRTGQIAAGQRLMMVGHPWGVPRKYDGGAVVRDNTEPTFFQANLDSSRGNSGSPVVNLDSMVVEGLLTRGQQEFVADTALGCDRSWVCPDAGCTQEGRVYWEAVTRATTFSVAVPSFEVYLGTDPDHLELAAANLAAPRFAPTGMRKDAVYYWRVAARNAYGQTDGPIWSFRMAFTSGASSAQ